MSEPTPDLFAAFGPQNPLIMSAAGLCKVPDLDQISPLAAAADMVVIGSVTTEPRPGNSGASLEYFGNPLYSVNSWGMPNPGLDAMPETPNEGLQELITGHKLVLSLAEFSISGYLGLFQRLQSWCGAIELNFGCPNIRDDGAQHKIVSFDPHTLQTILSLIWSGEEGAEPAYVGVKLSPYSDPGLLAEVAAVIAGSGNVNYVATTNTFPNGRAYTPGHKPALSTDQAGALGGIGGEAMKPISLANAAQFRSLLPDDIHVIRVGGISTGEDLWQSYDVGCQGVQVFTAIAQHGPQILTTIRQQYADIVSG